jgi:hypothetical protein
MLRNIRDVIMKYLERGVEEEGTNKDVQVKREA